MDRPVRREVPRRNFAADLCPPPGFTGDGPAAPWSRWWMLVWHLLFYGMLVGFTTSLLASRRAGAAPALGVALAALLAGWYTSWMVVRPDLVVRSRALRATYFIVGAGLWLGLVAVDRNYTTLAVVASVQLFGYLRLRWALAGMAVVLLVWVAGAGLRDSLSTAGTLQWRGLAWVDVGSALVSVTLLTLCLYLFNELSRTRSELAASERQAGIQDERQRIAGDVHDTLTQGLASVVMLLEAAGAAVREGRPDAGRRIEDAASTAREGLRDARRLVWDLRPEALERGTLGEALSRLTAELADQTGVAAKTVITGEPRPLSPELEVAALRVAQEALANVRRHGRAREATVTLSYMKDALALDVQDDGVGFNASKLADAPGPAGGLGLVAMRERVEAVGGTLSVESVPGEGTTVAAHMPTEPIAPPATSSPVAVP